MIEFLGLVTACMLGVGAGKVFLFLIMRITESTAGDKIWRRVAPVVLFFVGGNGGVLAIVPVLFESWKIAQNVTPYVFFGYLGGFGVGILWHWGNSGLGSRVDFFLALGEDPEMRVVFLILSCDQKDKHLISRVANVPLADVDSLFQQGLKKLTRLDGTKSKKINAR